MVDPKLTTFLTLVEEKTTVRCAEALHLSQPAVTQHIRSLEAEYGVKLFAKEGRRLTLTEAGARFYRLARRLPAMEAQLRAALAQGEAAPLHFGVTRSIGEGLMPRLAPAMLDALPKRSLQMRLHNTRTLLEELDKGEIEFALIEGNASHRRYCCRPFYTARFSALGAAEGRWAGCKTLASLCSAPLLVRETGSGSREILESALAARGLAAEDFAGCHVFESVPVLLELAAADKGVTFAYEVAAAPLLAGGRLARLAEKDFSLTRPFTFVTLPDSPFARQEQYLFEHIRDLCARLRAVFSETGKAGEGTAFFAPDERPGFSTRAGRNVGKCRPFNRGRAKAE